MTDETLIWGKGKYLPDLAMALRCYIPELSRQLRERKIRVLIYETVRSEGVQDAMYAQGRTTLEKVNALRKAAKMPPLIEGDNRKIVTNAKPGQSPHNYGLALDCVPVGKKGKPLWAHGKHWVLLAEAVERSGLQWGGYFRGGTKEKPTDGPHIELPQWRSVARGEGARC